MVNSPVRAKSFAFALSIVQIANVLRQQHQYVLSDQLLRAGASIGANVEEAQAGQSRRDFLSKMAIASKEARETKYWLRLVNEAGIAHVNVAQALSDVEELIRLLTAIVKTTGRPQ